MPPAADPPPPAQPAPAHPASPPVTIRAARAADVPRLVELLEFGSRVPGKEDPADLARYEAALAEISADPRATVLLAEVDGEPVGTCQLFAVRHLQNHGGLCAEIESMHVHPQWRGRGVGAQLLAAAVAQARDWDCYRVQLTSHKDRTDAHRFYRRAGFEDSHEGFKLPLH